MESKIETLREIIAAGIEELDRGEAIDGGEVFDEVLEGLGSENGQS